MVVSLIAWLQALILSYGALGVFWAGFLEEVVWIIPSSLIQASFGFLLFQNSSFTFHNVLYLLVLVVIPASVGVTIGTLPFYALTYWGGRVFTHRYGKYFGIKPSAVEKFEHSFSETNKGTLSLVLARMIPIIPSTTTTILSGLVGVKFVPYVFATFFGTLPRVLFFSIVGWQFGVGYRSVMLSYGGIGASLFLLISVISVLIIAIVTKHKRKAK